MSLQFQRFLSFAISAFVSLDFSVGDLHAAPAENWNSQLRLKRELTALGYSPETTVEAVLEFIRAQRGGGELTRDEEKPDQRVLVDASGGRWTSETDGGVVEYRDSRGRHPLVFEAKAAWAKEDAEERMKLVLQALRAAGATPAAPYGGGHIQVKLTKVFEPRPRAFASLVNLALTYEPVLVLLHSHQRRVENARPLATTRTTLAQDLEAGLSRGSRTPLARYLGTGLNALLTRPGTDCGPEFQEGGRLAPFLKAESKPELSLRENCILAFLAHFGTRVVGDRTFAINLQSWRGAASRLKLHNSLEFRFFNAPETDAEIDLELGLIRALAIRALEGPAFLYEERFDPAQDLDSYFLASADPRREVLDLLGELKLAKDFQEHYLLEFLDPAKQAKRRARPL